MAVRYFASFVTNAGISYRVDLHDALYSGSSKELSDSGAGGFNLEYPGNDAERFEMIKGSAVSFMLMVDASEHLTLLSDIAGGSERRFSLVIFRDGRIWWCGHVAPDLIEIPDLPFPYVVRLTATDYLASLTMSWQQLTGVLAWKPLTFQEMIVDLLSYTELDQFYGADDTYLKMSVNWYGANMPEWDTAEAYKARVIADSGTIASASVFSASITAAREVLLVDSSCYLLQYRDRVEADGGSVVNLMAPLVANPDSILLTSGTYDLDGYNPFEKVLANVWGIAEGYGEKPKDQLEITVLEALKQILKRFGARIYFSDGSWCVDQVNNWTESTGTSRWYYADGSEQFGIWKEIRSVDSTGIVNRREAGGVIRFFRPLQSVEVEYRVKVDLNLASIRTGSIVQAVTSPEGDGYSFAAVGNIVTRRTSEVNARYYTLWYRVRLEVNNGSDFYCISNGDPNDGGAFNRMYWKGGAAQWVNEDGYYHIMVRAHAQAGVINASTQFQFSTPEIPLAGTIIYSVELYGWITAVNQFIEGAPANLESIIADESLLLQYNGEQGELVIQHAADSDTDSGAVLKVDDVRFGDGPLILSPGCLLIEAPIAEAPPIRVTGWRRNRSATAVDIGELLATEVLQGQQFATRRIDASFIMPDYSLRHRVVRSGKAYVFSGINYLAELDTWSGTWFEVASVTTGITPRVANKKRELPYAPQLPQQPAGDLYQQTGVGTIVTNQVIAQQQITATNSDISSGSITSIPIAAIGEAFLQAGDKIGIVLLEAGVYYEATISTTPTAGATSIAINALTVPFVQAGAPIIMPGRRSVRNIKIKDSGWIAGLAVAAGYIGTGSDKVRINTADGDVALDRDLAAGRDVAATRDVVAVANVKVGAAGAPKATISGANGNIATDGDVAVEKNLTVKEVVKLLGITDTVPSVAGEVYIKEITIGESTQRVLAIKE